MSVAVLSIASMESNAKSTSSRPVSEQSRPSSPSASLMNISGSNSRPSSPSPIISPDTSNRPASPISTSHTLHSTPNRSSSPIHASSQSTSQSVTPNRPPSPSPLKATSMDDSALDLNSHKDDSQGVFVYLDSFIKTLNRALTISEMDLQPSPVKTVQRPQDWQACYLSPGHTKLKREGKQLEQNRDRDLALLRAKFNGVLPFFRVWELKVEEIDGEQPTMGRGTPPRPHHQIFTRELSATRLFLKDYQKRRGMTRMSNKVNETAVDVNSLRKPKLRPMPTTINREPGQAKGTAAKTQSMSPQLLFEQRKSSIVHKQPHSKLYT